MRSALTFEKIKNTTLCRGTDVGLEVTPYRQRIWMPAKSMRPYCVAGCCVPWAAVKPTLSLNTRDKAPKPKTTFGKPSAASAATGSPQSTCRHVDSCKWQLGALCSTSKTKQMDIVRHKPVISGSVDWYHPLKKVENGGCIRPQSTGRTYA